MRPVRLAGRRYDSTDAETARRREGSDGPSRSFRSDERQLVTSSQEVRFSSPPQVSNPPRPSAVSKPDPPLSVSLFEPPKRMSLPGPPFEPILIAVLLRSSSSPELPRISRLVMPVQRTMVEVRSEHLVPLVMVATLP